MSDIRPFQFIQIHSLLSQSVLWQYAHSTYRISSIKVLTSLDYNPTPSKIIYKTILYAFLCGNMDSKIHTTFNILGAIAAGHETPQSISNAVFQVHAHHKHSPQKKI